VFQEAGSWFHGLVHVRRVNRNLVQIPEGRKANKSNAA
jgi:hypothetical protein